jgi:hypothetical protein
LKSCLSHSISHIFESSEAISHIFEISEDDHPLKFVGHARDI